MSGLVCRRSSIIIMSKFDEIPLGALVRDRISKFTGIANAKGRHLNGCHRMTITPNELQENGEEQKSITFDVQQVEMLGEGIAGTRDGQEGDWGDMKLGVQVRDRVTGYKGIAVCLIEWYSGKKRVTVQSQDLHKGQPIDLHEIDLANLEITNPVHIFGEAEEKRVEQAPVPGGPYPEPSNA
jgi:hypothetical protein